MGAIGYLNGMVMGGTTTVIHMRFDPVKYVEDMEQYDVTAIGGAPPVFVALLQVPGFADHDWSRVRGVSSGAAPLPVALIERLKATAAQRGDRRGLRAHRGDHAGHRQPVVPVRHAQARHRRRPGVRHRDLHPAARRRRRAARRASAARSASAARR